jgi:hypothetical protein
VGSFVATSGQKPWPSAGSFVAAYGQFFMAADSRRSSTWVVKIHRRKPDIFIGTRDSMGQAKLSLHSHQYWQFAARPAGSRRVSAVRAVTASSETRS